MNLFHKIISYFIGGYKTCNHTRIFKNTLYWINNDASLKDSVKHSISQQDIIYEDDDLAGEISTSDTRCQVVVTKNRTLEAAKHYSNKKICVLNFASAIHPGGGVTVSKSPSGQEECLCRVSTLYKCISTEKALKDFYYPHRNTGNNLHNDDIIYTPEVFVFKDDNNNLLDRKQWFTVDVISCAAPNIGKHQKGERETVDVENIELEQIHKRRAQRILDVAVRHHVDVVILGAFGCGAFGNPPEIVAAAYKSVLTEYEKSFNVIEFAVYGRTNEENYLCFKRLLLQ